MDTDELIKQVRATRDPQPWVREKAVIALVDARHGHLVPMEILADTPVRSRHKGRFCATRHIDTLHGVVNDAEGSSHSVWFCPAAVTHEGNHGTWVPVEKAGWLCSTCIHLKDWTEIVQSQRLDSWLHAENVQTSKRQYPVPTGERADRVLAAIHRIGIATMDEIVGSCVVELFGDAARKDWQTTSNTVYRLFKTGIVQKFGRGSRAVYCFS